jgi:hypothetical protein
VEADALGVGEEAEQEPAADRHDRDAGEQAPADRRLRALAPGLPRHRQQQHEQRRRHQQELHRSHAGRHRRGTARVALDNWKRRPADSCRGSSAAAATTPARPAPAREEARLAQQPRARGSSSRPHRPASSTIAKR